MESLYGNSFHQLAYRYVYHFRINMVENCTASSKCQEDCCVICQLSFEGEKSVNDLREYLTKYQIQHTVKVY